MPSTIMSLTRGGRCFSLAVWGSLVLVLALAGCARRPAAPVPAAGEMPNFDAINDPLESMNRCVSGFNRGTFNYVIYPFNVGYEFVVPRPVRSSISKFALNLAFPVRLINTALQGKFGGTLG